MKKRFVLVTCLMAAFIAVIALAGCGGPSVEELIRDDLTEGLDAIKSGDDEDILTGIEEGADGAFDELKIDSKEWLKAFTKDFDYKIGDITVDEQKGTAKAKVTITSKNMADVVTAFQTSFASELANMDPATTEDELYAKAGELFMKETEDAPTKETSCTFEYKRDGDTWDASSSIDEELGRALAGE